MRDIVFVAMDLSNMQAEQARYGAAVAHYQEGRFEQAWSELAPALDAPDITADALNLAAVCALNLNRPHDARALWHRAMIARPDDAGIPSNLGNLLTRLKEYDEAQAMYRRALEIQPESVGAHFNLALLYVEQQRWAEADAELARTIALSGDLAEAHRYRAKALEALERPADALACYEHVVRLRPDDEAALSDLVRIAKGLNRWSQVEQVCRDAVKSHPDSGWFHFELGFALQRRGALDGAIEAFERVIALVPDWPDAHSNLGNVLLRAQRPVEAEAAARSAVALQRGEPGFLCNLAHVLSKQNKVRESEALYRDALARDKNHAHSRLNLALLLLGQGRYEEGWLLHESRLDPTSPFREPLIEQMTYPQWQGEPLQDKHIVVVAEQGLGDGIQFSRYFPMLKARGAGRVTVVCQRPLYRLISNMECVDSCIVAGTDIPPHDYWCLSMSLPLRFGTTVESIPSSTPYLAPLPGEVARWLRRLPASAPKIGLVWAGDPRASSPLLNEADRLRSMRAVDFLPLLSIPGITFISLQKGEASSAQVAELPAALRPFDPMPGVVDFSDTAAIIASLDLVISVDTSTAHLAGAMNKPVWILSRYDGCWRWLHDRDDSPWYPSARLFRQRAPGDWGEVVGRVVEALRQWLDCSAY